MAGRGIRAADVGRCDLWGGIEMVLFFTSKRCPDLGLGVQKTDPVPPTEKQLGVQAKALELLIKQGSLTAWEVQQLGTTDARKLFTRLRQQGYLYPVGHEFGSDTVPNKNGSGTHRVHYWTGKTINEKNKA